MSDPINRNKRTFSATFAKQAFKENEPLQEKAKTVNAANAAVRKLERRIAASTDGGAALKPELEKAVADLAKAELAFYTEDKAALAGAQAQDLAPELSSQLADQSRWVDHRLTDLQHAPDVTNLGSTTTILNRATGTKQDASTTSPSGGNNAQRAASLPATDPSMPNGTSGAAAGQAAGGTSDVDPSGAQDTPVDPSGAQDTPVDPSGAQDTPVDPSGAQDTPVDPSGAQDTAVDPSGVQDTPVDPSGSQDTPVDPSGAQDTPVDPSGAQDTPVDPSGAQDTPVAQRGTPQDTNRPTTTPTGSSASTAAQASGGNGAVATPPAPTPAQRVASAKDAVGKLNGKVDYATVHAAAVAIHALPADKQDGAQGFGGIREPKVRNAVKAATPEIVGTPPQGKTSYDVAWTVAHKLSGGGSEAAGTGAGARPDKSKTPAEINKNAKTAVDALNKKVNFATVRRAAQAIAALPAGQQNGPMGFGGIRDTKVRAALQAATPQILRPPAGKTADDVAYNVAKQAAPSTPGKAGTPAASSAAKPATDALNQKVTYATVRAAALAIHALPRGAQNGPQGFGAIRDVQVREAVKAATPQIVAAPTSGAKGTTSSDVAWKVAKTLNDASAQLSGADKAAALLKSPAVDPSLLADAKGIVDGSNPRINARQWASLATALAQLKGDAATAKKPPNVYNAIVASLKQTYGADKAATLTAAVDGAKFYRSVDVDHKPAFYSKDKNEKKSIDDVKSDFTQQLSSNTFRASAPAVNLPTRAVYNETGVKAAKLLDGLRSDKPDYINDAKQILNGSMRSPGESARAGLMVALAQLKADHPADFPKAIGALKEIYGDEVAQSFKAQSEGGFPYKYGPDPRNPSAKAWLNDRGAPVGQNKLYDYAREKFRWPDFP